MTRFEEPAPVYVENPTPLVACRYGAPMGRVDSPLDPDCPAENYRATRIPLDDGGYDKGGAYWGIGAPLWFVEDGVGNGMFARGADPHNAILVALECS